MPEESHKKSNVESWRDWWPLADQDDLSPLLPRNEFLSYLNHLGVEVKETDLRWWEYEGFLPRPVLLWDPDAKARRAYYPIWAASSLFALRDLQSEGRHLRDMKPVLRAAAQNSAEKIHLIRMETHLQDPQEGVTEADMIDTIVLVEAMEATTHSVFYRDVWPALQRYVRLLERNDKWWHPEEHRETLAVEVTLIDVTGRKQRAGGFRILDEDGIYRQRQEGIPEGDDGYC